MSSLRVSAEVDVEEVVGRRERCWWKRLRRTFVARGFVLLEAAVRRSGMAWCRLGKEMSIGSYVSKEWKGLAGMEGME